MSIKNVRQNLDGGSDLAESLRKAGYHHFAAAVEAGQTPAAAQVPQPVAPRPRAAAPVSPPSEQDLAAEDKAVRTEGNVERKKQLESKRQADYDAAQGGAKGSSDEEREQQFRDYQASQK